MRRVYAVAALVLLTACSSSAEPSTSAEETVAYLMTGLKPGVSVNSVVNGKTAQLTRNMISENPFKTAVTTKLANGEYSITSTIIKLDNECRYSIQRQNAGVELMTIVVDFSTFIRPLTWNDAGGNGVTLAFQDKCAVSEGTSCSMLVKYVDIPANSEDLNAATRNLKDNFCKGLPIDTELPKR